MASQITGLAIVYSTIYSGADQRKHQSSASLAFVRGIHRWPVNSPHKGPVTRKWFHLMTSSFMEIPRVNQLSNNTEQAQSVYKYDLFAIFRWARDLKSKVLPCSINPAVCWGKIAWYLMMCEYLTYPLHKLITTNPYQLRTQGNLQRTLLYVVYCQNLTVTFLL